MLAHAAWKEWTGGEAVQTKHHHLFAAVQTELHTMHDAKHNDVQLKPVRAHTNRYNMSLAACLCLDANQGQ